MPAKDISCNDRPSHASPCTWQNMATSIPACCSAACRRASASPAFTKLKAYRSCASLREPLCHPHLPLLGSLAFPSGSSDSAWPRASKGFAGPTLAVRPRPRPSGVACRRIQKEFCAFGSSATPQPPSLAGRICAASRPLACTERKREARSGEAMNCLEIE